MTNAQRDDNRIPVIQCALNSDGVTPISIKADPSTHVLQNSNGTTGSDNGRGIAVRDQNRIPVLMAVSSADGVTPVELYADSNGNLLTQSI